MLKFYLMEQISYFIRPMRDEDIPQVSEIDREAFPAESLFRPYTSYSQEIHNSLAHYIVAYARKKPNQENRQKMPWLRRLFGRHHEILAMSKERSNLRSQDYILGFAGLWIMLTEAHIIAIAVRNDYRRIGIGEGLLISAIELATQLNANVVTLEVRASNIAAQALYDRYGFHVVGRRPRYYSDNNEDAVLMSTDSITSASFQARLQRLKQAHSQKQKIAQLV
jgi:ribosomal-protein-alanine N-acetyltransferase